MKIFPRKTRKFICKLLKIEDISRAIDMPFSQEDAQRNEAEIYNPLYRDIRLATGRYYTNSEYEKRAAEIKAIQLP
jgi:hypothetical protein